MEELIEKYIPVWIFHPNERIFPMCINTYVSFSQLKLGNGTIISTENFDDWVNTTPPEIQIVSTLVPELQQMTIDDNCPVYVFYVEKGDDVFISYYLFYRSNPAPLCILGCECCCGYHEADLEHVQVHLRNKKLERVYYSKHSGGNWVDKNNLIIQNEKPVVYVALNSHACYERAGMFSRIGGLVPDWTGYGRVLIPSRFEIIQGSLMYRGYYGNGHVSGFPEKSNWMKEDVNGYWRC